MWGGLKIGLCACERECPVGNDLPVDVILRFCLVFHFFLCCCDQGGVSFKSGGEWGTCVFVLDGPQCLFVQRVHQRYTSGDFEGRNHIFCDVICYLKSNRRIVQSSSITITGNKSASPYSPSFLLSYLINLTIAPPFFFIHHFTGAPI